MYVADCRGCKNQLVRDSAAGSKWNHVALQEELRINWHPPAPFNVRVLRSKRELGQP